AHLRNALEQLREIASGAFRVSRIYETEPVGPGPQDKYLNLCVRLSTVLNPRQLLERCQEIEARVGRIPRGRWAPREIDIDLLAFEGQAFRDAELTLPHPGLHERQFVLVPLAELDPDAVLPGLRESVSRLLQRC